MQVIYRTLLFQHELIFCSFISSFAFFHQVNYPSPLFHKVKKSSTDKLPISNFTNCFVVVEASCVVCACDLSVRWTKDLSVERQSDASQCPWGNKEQVMKI